MPGFPLAAIGAGLGLFAKQYQEQQAQKERNAMLQMQMQRFQQEMRDKQQEQQLASAKWQSDLSGLGDGGVTPTPGGASAVPSIGGGLPGGKAMPPGGGGGGSGGYWTPAGIEALQPTEGRWDQIHYPSGYTKEGVKSSASGGAGYLDSTWREFAPKAGVDLNQYPRAYLAPPEVQKKVIAITPISHWTGSKDGVPWNPAAQQLARNPAYVTGAAPGPQTASAGPEEGGGGAPSDAPPERAQYETQGPVQTDTGGYAAPGSPGTTSLDTLPPRQPLIPGPVSIVPEGAPRGQQMAQAGPQTATDAGPQITDAQAGKQLDQMIPPAVHRKMSLDALVRQVAKIPGLSDQTRAKLVEDRIKLLAPQEAEYAREYFDTQRANRSESAADRRMQHSDAAAAAREAAKEKREEAREKARWGDPVEMKGAPGQPSQYVQVNKATGEVRPVKGITGEITKIGTRGTAPPLEEAQATFWAQVLAQGGSLPPGLRRSGVVEQIMKKVPGEAQGMTPGDFIARHSGVKADEGSLRNMTRMSDAAISFEKLAEKNFDVALRLAPDAIPTDLGPFFNRWIEQGETLFGDPNVPPYVAAMLTGANEYAKVMSGATGAAGSTNESRRQAAEMFSPYFSLPQISQVIAVAKADMKNRENTLLEQVAGIKQRLGSSAPVEVAPPATPRATGQESQSTPARQAVPAGGRVPKDGDIISAPGKPDQVWRGGKWNVMQ